MNSRRLVGAAAVLAASALDSLAIFELLLQHSSWFIGFHLFACVLAVRGSRFIRHRQSQCWEILGLLICLPVPTLGCLAILIWSWQSPQHRPAPLEELREFVMPLEAQELKNRPTYRQEVRLATEIESQLDFKVNDVSVVRQLVEVDQGYWGPDKVEQLKQFKLNPKSDAFHLAQAELGKLQELFVVQISELRDQISRLQSEPRQLIYRQYNLYHRLAELYREYAESGLLEPDLAGYYLQCSIDRYQDLCDLAPRDPRWPRRKIELMLEHGLVQEALAEHAKACARFPDDGDLRLTGLQALFDQGQASQSQLKVFVEALQQLQFRPEQLDFTHSQHQERAEFWFGRAEDLNGTKRA